MSFINACLDLCAWYALLVLIFRSISVCVVAFASVNARLFVGASIQWHAVSKGSAAPTTRESSAGPDTDGQVTSSNPRRNTAIRPNSPQSPPSPQAQQRPSFRPTKFSPTPKPQQMPTFTSLMDLYEDIMASDAETIRMQQATISTQQEVIRAQRDMLRDLQRLVDAQDAWIDGQIEGEKG